MVILEPKVKTVAVRLSAKEYRAVRQQVQRREKLADTMRRLLAIGVEALKKSEKHSEMAGAE